MSDLTNLPLMGAETRIIQPPTPIQTDAGFFRNVGDNIANSWWFQQGASILQTNIPADPDFNPVDPELLKGKEEYIRYLQEARSLDHHNAIYDRIKAYEERRSRLAEEGGWGSALVGGLVDPSNFIGLGVGRGVGIARGLLTGAATTGLVSGGTAVLEKQVAPMETSEIYTRAAFGSVVGGLFGGFVGRNLPSNTLLNDLSGTLADYAKVMDEGVEKGSFGPNPADRSIPRQPFVARETGDSPIGFAPAMGVEKIVSEKIGDLGPMVASGHRSFEDLALSMAGTGQLMKRNLTGEASPESALTLSGYWTGLAGRTMGSVDGFYTKYISGGTEPTTIMGANVPAAMMRVGQAVGIRPREGKMTINEFYSAVSRAHFRDKIDSPISEVKEAALEVRKFFDEMRDYAVKADLIMTPQTAKRSLSRAELSLNAKKASQGKLSEKAGVLDDGVTINISKLSPNEKVEYSLLVKAINSLNDRIDYYRGAIQFLESRQKPGPQEVAGKSVDPVANDNYSKFIGPANEKYFLPRLWNLEKIMADELGDKNLRKIITQWFLEKPLEVNEVRLEKSIQTMQDINLSIQNYKTSLYNVIQDIESSIERQQAFVDYLERKYNTVGLTSKEIETLEYFRLRGKADVGSKANELLDKETLADVGPDKIYHGTKANAGFIDAKGNLVLKPSANFDGIQNGVSFSPDILVSADYASRVRGGGPNNFDFSNSVVFAINKEAISDRMIKISDLELFAEAADPIVIPAGQFEIIRVRDLPAAKEMLEVSSKATSKVKNLTDNELADIILSTPREPTKGQYFALDNLDTQAASFELKRRVESSALYKKGAKEINAGTISERDLVKSVLDDMGITQDVDKISTSLDLTAPLPRGGNDSVKLNTRTIVNPTLAQEALLTRLREKYENASGTPAQKAYLDILAERVANEELKKASIVRAEMRKAGVDVEGLSATEEARSIERRVNSTMAKIMKEAQDGELSIGRSNKGEFLMSRDLDIPNELVWDFIEDDINGMMRAYSQRMGRSVEFAKAFGERDAQDAIFDSAIQAAREMKGTEQEIAAKVQKLMGHAENLRDFTLGDVYSKNPLSLNRKIVSTGANFSTVTSLGRALYSSLTEPAKAIMMHGFGRTFGFAFNALTDRKAFGDMAADMRQLTGQALDTAMGLSMSRYGEQGGPINGSIDWAGRTLDKVARPLAKFTNGPYFVLNLLGPYTDALKNFSNVMNAHYILEDAKAVASGKASERTVKNMAALGFDRESAARLANMPFERDRALNLANIQNWNDDDLVRKFGSAVAAQTMRQVVTATEGDIPNIARGFIGAGDKRREIPYLRLPFQFMNFSFASTNKTLVSALQGREANVVGGLMSMLGLAYLSLWLKTPDKSWEKMPMEDRLVRTMEGSGFLGIFSDVSQKIEGISQNRFGVRPMLELEPRFGPRSIDELSPYSEAFGPAVGKGIDAYQLMFDNSMLRKEEARGIRRLIPMNDLFYLRGIVNSLEKSALDATY
jgi:hypothetical protein